MSKGGRVKCVPDSNTKKIIRGILPYRKRKTARIASFGIIFSFVTAIRRGSKSCGRYAAGDAMMAITEMTGALQTPPDDRPFAPQA